jgi:hypothetical protein
MVYGANARMAECVLKTSWRTNTARGTTTSPSMVRTCRRPAAPPRPGADVDHSAAGTGVDGGDIWR